MKAQTKLGAFWEAWQSTFIGLAMAWPSTVFIMPVCIRLGGLYWGATAFTLWMTALSLARQWAVRVWTERQSGKNVPPDFRHIIEDIAEERNRQIDREGFDLAHDDEHTDRSLAAAGAAYAFAASAPDSKRKAIKTFDNATVQHIWPDAWALSWFKPTQPRRDLVKAAALIVAEIGRLDRTKRRA